MNGISGNTGEGGGGGGGGGRGGGGGGGVWGGGGGGVGDRCILNLWRCGRHLILLHYQSVWTVSSLAVISHYVQCVARGPPRLSRVHVSRLWFNERAPAHRWLHWSRGWLGVMADIKGRRCRYSDITHVLYLRASIRWLARVVSSCVVR